MKQQSLVNLTQINVLININLDEKFETYDVKIIIKV